MQIMLDGTLERINEAALDRFGDFLVEGDDPIYVPANTFRGPRVMPIIRPRERDALLQSLRAGVVPRLGQYLPGRPGRGVESPHCRH